MNSIKLFTIQFLVFTSLFVGSTCVFNFIIDPYELFGNNLLPIEKKPFAHVHIRLHKIFQIHKVKPKTIILGTSRAGIGFNTTNALFHDKPVYNLGIDGANIYELSKYFEAALNMGSLKEVYLLLDFMSFNATLENKPDFYESLLTSSKKKLYFNAHFFRSLFSYDSLKDSLVTLNGRYDKNLPTLNAQGQTLEDALYYYMNTSKGRLNTSLNSERTYVNTVYQDYRFHYTQNKTTFDYLEKIIEQCHLNNINLYLIIGSIHARHQSLIYNLGLWDNFNTWKKTIFSVNQNIAKKHKIAAYPLWDFTEPNDVNNELMIESESDTPNYFWESTHFHQSLGNLILENIKNEHTIQESSKIGIQLAEDNINDVLEKNTNHLHAYTEPDRHLGF